MMIPKNLDWKGICKVLFKVEIYPYQEEMLKAAFSKKTRKITIRAATRAGKSYCLGMVAIAKASLLDNHRVGLIAPTYPKTKIIMSYVADLLAANNIFDQIVMVEATGLTKLERLRKEVSKHRITFKNGSSIEIKSVDLASKGFGVTGFAYDCLPAEAILTTDKGKITIGEIINKRMHVRVLSRAKNGKLEFRAITGAAIMRAPKQTTISTKRNRLRCTMNHPLYVKGRGFVKASEIKAGDQVALVGFG